MITISYYGALQDVLGMSVETLDWKGGTTYELLSMLRHRDDKWKNALADNRIFRIVVNEEICFETRDINCGDRVAFLPPVTGG